jgi:hypothetical protein
LCALVFGLATDYGVWRANFGNQRTDPPGPVVVPNFEPITDQHYEDLFNKITLDKTGSPGAAVTKEDLANFIANPSAHNTSSAAELKNAAEVLHQYYDYLQPLENDGPDLTINDVYVASTKDGDDTSLTRADIVAVLIEAVVDPHEPPLPPKPQQLQEPLLPLQPQQLPQPRPPPSPP